MEALSFTSIPTLNRPILLLAFAGWNDAGGAATFAAKFLAQRLDAHPFARIDPETFYNFTEQRPQVRWRDGEREIVWPANEFSYARDAGLVQDVIIGLGVEPHLRWRAYTEAILHVVRVCKVELVVTLGALLADVAYSRPMRLTGTASDPALARRLHLAVSKYEGPTGIVGVLHDTCRRSGLPAISIWANVPHYIAASPNVKAALALVRRAFTLLDFSTDLSDLERAAGDFDKRVAQVLATDPKIAEYIRRLEERDAEEEEEEEADNIDALPSGEDLVQELERFLREQRRERDED
jgi:proteasome assembly chaperone (PAC2) family protein